MRCYWCQNWIKPDGYCIACGRSNNLQQELYAQEERKKKHQNLQLTPDDVYRVTLDSRVIMRLFKR